MLYAVKTTIGIFKMPPRFDGGFETLFASMYLFSSNALHFRKVKN